MIEILPVPRKMFDAVWPHAAPHLIKGLTAATNVTLRQVIDDIVAGTDTLWVVADDNVTCGAFVTALFEDEDGKSHVFVYALGGYGLARWAEPLEKRMVEYARDAGVDCVRFVGRDAWSRVLPAVRITGRYFGRNAIFERAVA